MSLLVPGTVQVDLNGSHTSLNGSGRDCHPVTPPGETDKSLHSSVSRKHRDSLGGISFTNPAVFKSSPTQAVKARSNVPNAQNCVRMQILELAVGVRLGEEERHFFPKPRRRRGLGKKWCDDDPSRTDTASSTSWQPNLPNRGEAAVRQVWCRVVVLVVDVRRGSYPVGREKKGKLHT